MWLSQRDNLFLDFQETGNNKVELAILTLECYWFLNKTDLLGKERKAINNKSINQKGQMACLDISHEV